MPDYEALERQHGRCVSSSTSGSYSEPDEDYRVVGTYTHEHTYEDGHVETHTTTSSYVDEPRKEYDAWTDRLDEWFKAEVHVYYGETGSVYRVPRAQLYLLFAELRTRYDNEGTSQREFFDLWYGRDPNGYGIGWNDRWIRLSREYAEFFAPRTPVCVIDVHMA